MQKKDGQYEKTEVISMEEYLTKRKKVREREKRSGKKQPDRLLTSLAPLGYYLVPSSSLS